jgi:predicted HicB family RNase H-like nuclease
MNADHYTYRVTWSPEDSEYVGLCTELPSLSWLAKSPGTALAGIRKVAAACVIDLKKLGEPVPIAFSEREYSGHFKVRIPSQIHRNLTMKAAEEGISLNRLASAKLAT